MRNALAVFAITLAVVAHGQQTGPATAKGTCNIAISGNNVTLPKTLFSTDRCGIGAAQGQKIVDLLNQVLKSGDAASINAKLDSLLIAASRPDQNQTCVNGGPCVQNGNQYNYDNRTYGVPKPLPAVVGLTQRQDPAFPRPSPPIPNASEDQYWPTVALDFSVNMPFANPMFAYVCDRPCTPLRIYFGDTFASFGNAFFPTTNPLIWVSTYGMQNMLVPGMRVTVIFRSLDDKPVSISRVEAFAP